MLISIGRNLYNTHKCNLSKEMKKYFVIVSSCNKSELLSYVLICYSKEDKVATFANNDVGKVNSIVPCR